MSICSANWVVGSWGRCDSDPVTGNGLQRRSITCPSGYLCPGAKPLEFKACKGKVSINMGDFKLDFGGSFDADIDYRGPGGFGKNFGSNFN